MLIFPTFAPLMQLTATNQFGLKNLLAEELRELGAESTKVGTRAIEFAGNQKLLYNTLLWSRLAMRVLQASNPT